MIEIILYERRGKKIGFLSSGHAEYDEVGEDVVCAAISVLSINCANSIEMLTEDKFEVDYDDDGLLKLLISNQPSKEATLLLASYELGVNAIREEYGHDYINIRIEEV